MSKCLLCKKDFDDKTDNSCGTVLRDDWLLIGRLCAGCTELTRTGKIRNIIEAAGAFMDQLNSFNDFYHPEVHRRALELQKAVGELYA